TATGTSRTTGTTTTASGWPQLQRGRKSRRNRPLTRPAVTRAKDRVRLWAVVDSSKPPRACFPTPEPSPMSASRPTPPLFLDGQKLCELADHVVADERRFHVCGRSSEKPKREPTEPQREAWPAVARRTISQKAAGRERHRRV